jgi:hypothetical protein
MKQVETVAYRSYLLRLWQVHKNGGWVKRASLQEVGTGAYRVFDDLNGLVLFLSRELPAQQSESEELE